MNDCLHLRIHGHVEVNGVFVSVGCLLEVTVRLEYKKIFGNCLIYVMWKTTS